jgi:sigma-B regulation protein RsbU (phosphoserine phosphatase)
MQHLVEANDGKSKATFQSLLDTLQDSYFEADERGFITYVNAAFCKNLGYPQKTDVVGKHFRHFTDRNFVRGIFQYFSQVYETKKLLEPFPYKFRTRDGMLHIAETTVSPIMEGDVVIGTRGLMRDITDRVAAEEALRVAKEEVDARADELAAINRVAVIANQSLNLTEILQTLAVELTRIFPVRNAGIGLVTGDRKSLEIVAFHAVNPKEESALGLLLPFEGNLSAQEAFEKKKIIVIQDAQNDVRTRAAADIYRERGTKAIMIVPLLARGKAIGTIGMPARDPDHLFSDNEIRLAETIASQIASAIDNARLHAITESALDVAERDLEIGRQIQAGFFPAKLPEPPGWEICAHFEGARQVAGDFYDAFQLGNSKSIALVIADVCDKGVGAALFMVLFRSLLRAFSANQTDITNHPECLKQIILNTNNFIAEIHGRSNMFATLFYGILDPDSGDLYYVNGGHEPPVVIDKGGKIIQRLIPTGPAVGLFPDLEFRVEKVHFNKGDTFLGFTDGAADAKNPAGKAFSEERLLEIIQSPWTSAFSLLFELNNELHKHIGSQFQFDDITFLSFTRKARPGSDHHAICRVAQLDILGELRSFVDAAASHSGLSQDDIFAFKLAGDEACANIIQHGFEEHESGFIVLAFEAEPQKARLIIQDNGTHFPPGQADSPDLEAECMERRIGGLGIYLIKQLMSNVSYNKAENNLNTLILERDLARKVI